MTTELLGVLQEIVKNYMNAIKMTDKATGTVTKNSNSYGRVKSGRQGPAPPSPKRAAVYCIIKDHIRRSSWQYYRKVWGLM